MAWMAQFQVGARQSGKTVALLNLLISDCLARVSIERRDGRNDIAFGIKHTPSHSPYECWLLWLENGRSDGMDGVSLILWNCVGD